MSMAASLLRSSLSTGLPPSVDMAGPSHGPTFDADDDSYCPLSPTAFSKMAVAPFLMDKSEITNKVEKAAAVTEHFPGCFHHGPAPPVAQPGSGADAIARVAGTWQLSATRNYAAANVLMELGAQRIKCGGVRGLRAAASHAILDADLDDTFYMLDLANVVRLYKAWAGAMPRVVPFYAVKCLPDPGLLRLLAALGTGFDCASKGEVEQVLQMGVHPSRIIFAHPCKRVSDIRYARDVGVTLTTFDTESELAKVALHHPGFKCVLRIRADDPEARVHLGLKYGADPSEAARLLAAAQRLGVAVVGVSFHVGSACKNLAAFTDAIAAARQIFDTGIAMGFPMELLDIGGGFTGHFDSCGNVMFGDIAAAVNGALAASFPPESGVRVIAEPGRYFAEAAASLLAPVYGVRERPPAVGGDGRPHRDYWITDGLYGSFNCILYDGQTPTFEVLRACELAGGGGAAAAAEASTFPSTIWGPTCDSADCVFQEVELSALDCGDWLLFPNAGAYTLAGACSFNGIDATAPHKAYVWSESAVDAAASEEGDGDVGAAAEEAGAPAL